MCVCVCVWRGDKARAARVLHLVVCHRGSCLHCQRGETFSSRKPEQENNVREQRE